MYRGLRRHVWGHRGFGMKGLWLRVSGLRVQRLTAPPNTCIWLRLDNTFTIDLERSATCAEGMTCTAS